LIATAVKKFVLAAILSTVAKALAAKLGIAAGSAFAVVLLPLVAAFIAYEVATFPEHLGAKVSEKVATEIGENFEKINENVVAQIVGQFARTGLVEMARLIGQDPDVHRNVLDLLADAT
jgi:mannose/fructose/N-acetylgalactosamine-specific phosphotransferase system component IID